MTLFFESEQRAHVKEVNGLPPGLGDRRRALERSGAHAPFTETSPRCQISSRQECRERFEQYKNITDPVKLRRCPARTIAHRSQSGTPPVPAGKFVLRGFARPAYLDSFGGIKDSAG